MLSWEVFPLTPWAVENHCRFLNGREISLRVRTMDLVADGRMDEWQGESLR